MKLDRIIYLVGWWQ